MMDVDVAAQKMTAMAAYKGLYAQQRLPEQLFYAMERRRVSFREAAAEMGISHAALHRVSQGKSPTVEHFLRIKRWLQRFHFSMGGKPSNEGEGAECIRNAIRYIYNTQARFHAGSVEHRLLGDLSAEMTNTILFPVSE